VVEEVLRIQLVPVEMVALVVVVVVQLEPRLAVLV
jgi:hypothetical protein